MNNQPNWDEAPEGATHLWLGRSNYPWYKVEGREKYQYFNETNQWIKIYVSDAYFTSGFVTRPTINQQLTVVKEKFTTEEVVCSKMEPTSWDGEGLPPIGTICEMYIDEIDEWVQGEVFAIHKGHIHIWNDKAESGCFTNNPTDLRPIKSNRDKWIESIIENKEELYRQLGYRYDTIVGNKG